MVSPEWNCDNERHAFLPLWAAWSSADVGGGDTFSGSSWTMRTGDWTSFEAMGEAEREEGWVDGRGKDVLQRVTCGFPP